MPRALVRRPSYMRSRSVSSTSGENCASSSRNEAPAVGQTHLAGTRRRATADEREMRRSVVWRAEWPRSEQRALGIDEAGDAVDRARDDRLIGIERGQERRDRASKERLARSRRSDEEEAVPAG